MRWVFRAIVLFAVVIGAFLGAERLIVYPLDPRQENPADHELSTMSEVIFDTGGTELVIWTAPAVKGKPTILYLHGNAGNLADRQARFRILTKRGYGIVAPAYRGSSGSKGWPREAAILDDMKAVYGALVQGNITGAPVQPVIYGESIGAAVTIHLNATHLVRNGVRPLAILLEAPFTSLRDVARDIYPEMQLLTGFMLSRWRSVDFAPQLNVPLLVLHGEYDPLIPIAQGRQIFETAASGQKEFYLVKGAGHVDVWQVLAQRKLLEFLSKF